MWPAVIWLAVGLALASAEVLSGEFVLLMLGGGAIAAGIGALLGLSVVGSALVFVVVSVLLVFAVRPPLRRRLDRATAGASALHSDALVGRTAVVVARVDDHGGRVRIGGDVWTARPLDGGREIEEGESVIVMRISGATALVVPED
ncbi:MAG: NfeD family protein [Pseudonocardia sp.]|nr:NfeD family protein [Pseudonocardia sp.]